VTTWREQARPIIAAVIARFNGEDSSALRSALRAAYPFGPREYHPYKIWLSEIRRQLNKERDKRRTKGEPKPPEPPDPNQKELF
jgi:hypothetical protein